MYRIGVDVGGTNTDAAILDTRLVDSPSRGVLASSKHPTTPDVTTGIANAVEQVLAQSQVARDEVRSVAIGTTHFVNAVVEVDARRLSRVAVIRLCGPFTRQLPPFTDFPPTLRGIIEGPVFYLDGGLEIDGREITPLNPSQIAATATHLQHANITTIALISIFAPLDHRGAHEARCKQLLLTHNPSFHITCSHPIAGIGLLARENATILNAAILPLAQRTVRGFRRAMARLRLPCARLYLTQNDGTLTDARVAAHYPIRSFASGPTNSMAGAAFLAGLDREQQNRGMERQVVVVDVGGTTTDVCALLPSGFPRQAPGFVEVGGVRTAFSMPEVRSIGLGGGSVVRVDEERDEVTVGPDSVGHRIQERALVFGGDVMTATDVVVAAGADAGVGDQGRVREKIPPVVVDRARRRIKKMLEAVIDEMKVSAAPVVALMVGGGSIIQMDPLNGVVECIRPPHHGSANAVGAAIAKVAGEVDVIEILEGRDENAVRKAVEAKAIAMAVAKGADPADVHIAELEKYPLQYVTNKATRFVVKAVGKLALPSEKDARSTPTDSEHDVLDESSDDDEAAFTPKEAKSISPSPSTPPLDAKPSLHIDIPTYRPCVRNGVWYLSAVDLEFIATGTGVLGTGGGGPSYLQYLVGLQCLRNGGEGKMRVIPAITLAPDAVCAFGSWYGAPSVSGERIPAGTEVMAAVDAVNRVMGYAEFDALVADEIGGGNGMVTFPSAVWYGRPVVDADLMGRAYPTIEHGTPYVYGAPITPCAIADPKGNVSVVMSAESNERLEKLLRLACTELGLKVAVACRPLSGQTIRDFAIPNTVSQAWYLGRAIHQARKAKTDVVKAIFDVTPGCLLYTGKIIDVQRDISRGYTVGRCIIRPLSADEQEQEQEQSEANGSLAQPETRRLIIPFQNEFLYAAYLNKKENDETEEEEQPPLALVPDLITLLGPDGEAIGSQDLRYGLRVRVIGMPAHPLWTGDERGLRVGGPAFFDLEGKVWRPSTVLGAYRCSRSVVEEFGGVGG